MLARPARIKKKPAAAAVKYTINAAAALQGDTRYKKLATSLPKLATMTEEDLDQHARDIGFLKDWT